MEHLPRETRQCGLSIWFPRPGYKERAREMTSQVPVGQGPQEPRTTKYASAAISAAQGSVTTHESKMPAIDFHCASPVVIPIPSSDPTLTCVVLTGNP